MRSQTVSTGGFSKLWSVLWGHSLAMRNTRRRSSWVRNAALPFVRYVAIVERQPVALHVIAGAGFLMSDCCLVGG